MKLTMYMADLLDLKLHYKERLDEKIYVQSDFL